ncbi:hypothetical protein [Halegenticoccus tardaugens]|uniref:hypothetical protein n=1 Tax=Halegenticoccus tardaugens TaxID=2071624 RepID=UPI001E34E70D|nr:hypothetical protein [Halegenticoccus tardaugens]
MMTNKDPPLMTDDQYRGILTPREQEILAGEADVDDNYRYRVVSRVRRKIEIVGEDLDLLEKHHPDLATKLRSIVCENTNKVD